MIWDISKLSNMRSIVYLDFILVVAFFYTMCLITVLIVFNLNSMIFLISLILKPQNEHTLLRGGVTNQTICSGWAVALVS